MKAPSFRYVRPTSLEEALDVLAQADGQAQILAGGQSLMPMLAMRIAAPEILVDINRIPELAGITLENDLVRIGALTRYVELEKSSVVAEHLPLIARALPHVAHVAIRNRGTIGGSLSLADPAAEMPACALALGAEIELVSKSGVRSVGAEDYFLGLYETARQPDEILAAVRFPAARSGSACGFYELSRRHGDFALAGAACTARVEGGALKDLRVAMFGCDDRPVLAKKAAAEVERRGTSPEALAAAAEVLAEDVAPTDNVNGDAETRLHYAKVVFRRAVAMLLESTRG